MRQPFDVAQTTARDISTVRPNARMTDDELREYLQENGYPEHVWHAGREGLLDRWRKFVAEVERGYRFGLEDYRNDLDLRGVISLVGLDAQAREADAHSETLLTARYTRVW